MFHTHLKCMKSTHIFRPAKNLDISFLLARGSLHAYFYQNLDKFDCFKNSSQYFETFTYPQVAHVVIHEMRNFVPCIWRKPCQPFHPNCIYLEHFFLSLKPSVICYVLFVSVDPCLKADNFTCN